jgi:alkylation response protein AidB-like acyl-CoA dehydrogenase
METSTGAADLERELVAFAASFGDILEADAERHDRDGTFVEESYRALRDAGLLAIGVPEELGGRGATIRQLAMVQRELARHCGSTALATAMHQHVVAFAAWRYRRGMRGTGSNDVVFDDVFVPDAAVGADRPHGVIDPFLQVVGSIAQSIVAAVYLGVAEGARSHALVAAAAKADDVMTQRQVGLMTHRLRVAAWALDGALAVIGDDPEPSMENFAAVLAAKREIALAGLEVCDLALEVGGGAAYFKGSPLERAYRDVRAVKYHPLGPEATLVHQGQLALGLPADRW